MQPLRSQGQAGSEVSEPRTDRESPSRSAVLDSIGGPSVLCDGGWALRYWIVATEARAEMTRAAGQYLCLVYGFREDGLGTCTVLDERE